MPLSKTSMYKEEEKNNKRINVFRTFEPILSTSEINNNNIKLDFRKKLKINLKLLGYKYQKYLNKKKKKKIQLFLNFFINGLEMILMILKVQN